MLERERGVVSWAAMGITAALLACSGMTEQVLPGPAVVTLGPTGGTINFPDGVSFLSVPPGALNGDVVFSVSPLSGVPGSGLFVQGTAFTISPIMQFEAPARLHLSYAQASLPPGVQDAEVAVHRVEGKWVAVEPSVADAAARMVEVDLPGTDTVGLLGRAATVLSVSPAAVDLFIGDSLRLTATPLDALGAALPNRAIAWTSTNPGVVRVRNDGTIIGSGEGGAVVNAYTDTSTATVRIDVKPRPPQSALYPNQPPGATVLMDYDTDFGSVTVPPWDFASGTANLATVVDPTAPHNPNVVGRVRFQPGCCGGTGPARLETFTGSGRGTPPAGWAKWYISDWVKLSSGWSANAEGIQSLFSVFANAGSGSGVWISFRLDGAGPYTPRIAIESDGSATTHATNAITAVAGQWYQYEAVIWKNGRVQFWVNNALVYDGTPGVGQFSGEYVAWTWTYGGASPYGGTSDGFIYHNHMRVSYTSE
jgi:hypothetical protein